MGGLVSAYDFDTRHISDGFSLDKFQKNHYIEIEGVLTYTYPNDEQDTEKLLSIGWRIGDYIIAMSHTVWMRKIYVMMPPPFFGQYVDINPVKTEMRGRHKNGPWYDLKLKSMNEGRDIAIFILPEGLKKVKKIPLGKLSKVRVGDHVYAFGRCLKAWPDEWAGKASTWKIGIVAAITLYRGHQEIIIHGKMESGDSGGVVIAFSNGIPRVIGLTQIDIGTTGLAGAVPIDYYVEEVKKLSKE